MTAPSSLLYRGAAGAIDPVDPPYPPAYDEALAQVEGYLGACIGVLGTMTSPEPDLRHLCDVLTAARDGIIRPRRGGASQCTFAFYEQTSPRD